MDHEFDRKPNDSQDKRQQAKNSFQDLQKLMEQFQITADAPAPEQERPAQEPEEAEQPEMPEEDAEQTEQPVLSVDELIERAAIASGEVEEVESEPEKQEKTAQEKPEKTETQKPVQKKTVESEEPKKPEQKKTAAAPKKKVIRKKELKAAEIQEDREQKEREAILEGRAKRRHSDQPTAAVNRNQTTKQSTKKSANTTKKKRKNSAAARARRRKKRLIRLGTVVVLLLIAIVLVVSAVRAITGREKNPTPAGSAVMTEADKVEKRRQEGPASQKKSKQYLAIKDDDSLPSYAKKYPGLYSDAVDEPNVLSEEKVCYLTFDDGPSSSNTPGILDVLKKAKVKATFFVVTSEIDEDTEPILRRIVDEGHTLCIHANEHEYGDLYASTEAYLEDFAAAYDKIYELTGYRVQGFRFPGGSNGQVNSSGCYDNIVKEMTRRGFEYYDWNAYNHDAEGGGYTAEQMVQYAVHEVEISSRNDVILLMHDTYGKEKTVEALPSIIRQLKEQDIKMLPITNSTRPVHFEVSDTTPPEYDDTAEEDSTDSSDNERGSDSDSDENT